MSWCEATIYCIACVFGAAVVRGYSGFGFSLLATTSLSLVLAPAEAIPPAFMMEIAASLSLLPGVWRDIQWRAISWMWSVEQRLDCMLTQPFREDDTSYALGRREPAP